MFLGEKKYVWHRMSKDDKELDEPEMEDSCKERECRDLLKEIPHHILFTWVMMSNSRIYQSERYAKATKSQLRPRSSQAVAERESEEGQIVGLGQQEGQSTTVDTFWSQG